ncbi:MAG TPA: GNAT family N-acetyltransferase [Chloroflexota bacterium]|nr:GNAT family N-acetyltransferase [Chloroflexota bacterium]
MAENAVYRGERVTIRHLVRADVDQMASWPRFHEVELQWANLDLTFTSEREAYFDRGRTTAHRHRFVILDERGVIIGTIGLRNLDYLAGEGTLGIIIRADTVGRGYGTDAVETILGYAFDVLDLRRVLLDVAEDNERARHVYDKLGFTPTGEHLGPRNTIYVDMVLERNEYYRRWRSKAKQSTVRPESARR